MDCARCRLHCGCGGLCFWLVLRDAACIVVVVRFVFVWLFACLHYGCGRCCFCLVVRDAAWIVVAVSFFFLVSRCRLRYGCRELCLFGCSRWRLRCSCGGLCFCLVVRLVAFILVAVGFVFVRLFALSPALWLRWAAPIASALFGKQRHQHAPDFARAVPSYQLRP